MKTFEKVSIELDENPKVVTDDISQIGPVSGMISEIIIRGLAIKEIEEERKLKQTAIQTAKQKLMDHMMVAFLESPDGLISSQILIETETDNLLSILGQLRAYFKSKLYTLRKKRKNKITHYYIDPIR